MNNTVKLGINSARSRLLSRKIGIFLAHDLRAYSLVESAAFKDLVETLEPRYAMPSRMYFSNTVVPGLYQEVKGRVLEEMTDAISVS